jgi:hypothetical protein
MVNSLAGKKEITGGGPPFPAIFIFFQPQKKENHGRSGIGPPVVCPVRRFIQRVTLMDFYPGQTAKTKSPTKSESQKK